GGQHGGQETEEVAETENDEGELGISQESCIRGIGEEKPADAQNGAHQGAEKHDRREARTPGPVHAGGRIRHAAACCRLWVMAARSSGLSPMTTRLVWRVSPS